MQNAQNLWRAVGEARCAHEWLTVARPELPVAEEGNAPWRTLVRVAVTGLARRIWIENVWVPHLAARWGADLIFTPMGAGPLRGSIPTVIGWHDSYVAYPESPMWDRCSRWDRGVAALRARYARAAARRALRICVQTDIMARRLARVWGIDRRRLRVIPNGPSRFLEGAGPAGGVPSARAESEALGAAAATDPLVAAVAAATSGVKRVLVVAEPQPAKNLEIIPAVAAALHRRGRRDVEIVLTVPPHGGPYIPYMKAVERALGAAEAAVPIRRIGRVPHTELPALYRSGAAVFVPSWVESFSAAYVEAMQFGLPIVTSDLDFARAICGDAAVYVSPLDPEACADGLVRVLEDGGHREGLRAAGLARFRTLPDWRVRFAEYVKVCEEAVREASSRRFANR
ncbi:MAG: glycosyltransferase [Gemmatimonadetes bacterium]|nr:glycosyltransferase [Gemmatimonadota bacterium]